MARPSASATFCVIRKPILILPTSVLQCISERGSLPFKFITIPLLHLRNKQKFHNTVKWPVRFKSSNCVINVMEFLKVAYLNPEPDEICVALVAACPVSLGPLECGKSGLLSSASLLGSSCPHTSRQQHPLPVTAGWLELQGSLRRRWGFCLLTSCWPVLGVLQQAVPPGSLFAIRQPWGLGFSSMNSLGREGEASLLYRLLPGVGFSWTARVN